MKPQYENLLFFVRFAPYTFEMNGKKFWGFLGWLTEALSEVAEGAMRGRKGENRRD